MATYKDFVGFVEINGVRVREFNTYSTGANGPGLRVLSMNYHCQVSDIFRVDVNITGDISREDGQLFTQFIQVCIPKKYNACFKSMTRRVW